VTVKAINEEREAARDVLRQLAGLSVFKTVLLAHDWGGDKDLLDSKSRY